jgi:transcriptional regulator with XRE-family HTH domain
MFQHTGLAIRIERERQGISLASLAGQAAVGKSQLSKYETGKELPKLESLARVLDALGTDPLTLFFWANRLMRRVSEEDVQAEMLRAGMQRSAESETFERLFGCAFDVYRLYVDAQMGRGPLKQATRRDER